MGESSNPSFQRGMLKGLVRTIRAGNHSMSVVCRVRVYESDDKKNVCVCGSNERPLV